MIKKTYKVINEQGIHSKIALELVNKASLYSSTLSLKFNKTMVDLKSIMGVMSLGVYSNEEINILALGDDEELAIEGIESVLTSLNIAKEIKNSELDN